MARRAAGRAAHNEVVRIRGATPDQAPAIASVQVRSWPPHGCRARLHLSADSYRTAILWVLVTNERARRFYDAAGWVCDGAEKTELVGGTASITETR